MKIYNSEQLYHVMALIQKLEKENICTEEQLEAINEWYCSEYEKLYLFGYNPDNNTSLN